LRAQLSLRSDHCCTASTLFWSTKRQYSFFKPTACLGKDGSTLLTLMPFSSSEAAADEEVLLLVFLQTPVKMPRAVLCSIWKRFLVTYLCTATAWHYFMLLMMQWSFESSKVQMFCQSSKLFKPSNIGPNYTVCTSWNITYLSVSCSW